MNDDASGYCTLHARQRAEERLGFVPTPEEWRDTALAVLDSLGGTARALMLRHTSQGGEVWMVSIRGVPARVVWSPEQAMIITVLEKRAA